jgi:hypothetical protein
MEGGMLAYHRDGETIPQGLLGDGLVDAVNDDPAAREAAETYHGRMVGGFVANLAGLGCFIGGAAWALSSEDSSSDNQAFDLNEKQSTILLASTVCLLAGAITGSVLMLSGQAYHWDAINIYNDNAEARALRAVTPPTMTPPGQPLPPPTPPQTPSPATTAPPPAAPPPASSAPQETPPTPVGS